MPDTRHASPEWIVPRAPESQSVSVNKDRVPPPLRKINDDTHASLARQVSRLQPLDRTQLDDVAFELTKAHIPWKTEYSEYQSAGWLTSSLINHSGKSSDNRIRLAEARGTELLARLPRTAALIEDLQVDVFWARLARLDPDSFLWEHVDYEEFPEAQATRLHIPIDTHPAARLVFSGASVWMPSGHVWRLNPRDIHGAANLGDTPRLHLLIDCLASPSLRDMTTCEDLPADLIEALPLATTEQLEAACSHAEALAKSGRFDEAEKVILTLFHKYHMEPGGPYSLLIKLYGKLTMQSRRDLWVSRRSLFLGTNFHA